MFYKLSGIQALAIQFSASVSWAAPARFSRTAKQALTIFLMVSVTGCGGGESTSETTPTNPEPTQPSITQAVQADLARVDQESTATGLAPQEIRGDLGNSTLLPGTYRAGQSLEISAGDLILDAQDNVNAVWVFQIAGDLRVADGRQVILIGGAQAGNIYWLVGGSAQVGEYSVLPGYILP